MLLSDENEPANKIARGEEDNTITSSSDRLKLIGDALRDQFHEVECVFESNRATYEITTDGAFDASALLDGKLVCHVTVEFDHDDKDDTIDSNAQVMVECADTKLASHVRDCIRNVAAAAAPLQF